MVFSSLSFLIVFLPILIIVFFAIPAKWGNCRQYILLLFSLLFYASGEPLYILLIVACVLFTWVLSKFIDSKNKVAVVLSILINLVPLVITKYAGFICQTLCTFVDAEILSVPEIVMPIGISFYTFQVISYILDLYGGKIERQENVFLFALYIMFFPQLVAGPIVKYSEIAQELINPDVQWKNIEYGVGRFILGLGKKVLIANQAGYIASSIQTCTLESLTSGMVWLCTIAYTIQIYFDFSGYSEMAIGLGSIFGFHFPENFQDPYAAMSITDFWRRWHITLGRFFREYVYIPLGGNRVSKLRWLVNIFVVWFLTGLWHGASWNFVVWGLYYGVLIIIEKYFKVTDKLPKVMSWALTFFFVILGWGIFMCDNISLAEMFRFLGKLFMFSGDVINQVSIGSLRLWGYLPFLAMGLFIATPAGIYVKNKLKNSMMNNKLVDLFIDVGLIGIMVLSLVFLVGSTYNPFIYFRF